MMPDAEDVSPETHTLTRDPEVWESYHSPLSGEDAAQRSTLLGQTLSKPNHAAHAAHAVVRKPLTAWQPCCGAQLFVRGFHGVAQSAVPQEKPALAIKLRASFVMRQDKTLHYISLQANRYEGTPGCGAARVRSGTTSSQPISARGEVAWRRRLKDPEDFWSGLCS